MTNEKTALVLGAGGGIGGAITEALGNSGWKVVAMVRNPVSAGEQWKDRPHQPIWIEGDAMVSTDVIRAAKGVSVIVHAVNPPGYRNWGKLVLPMIDNTIAAARLTGARIVLPGTIYNFNPALNPLIGENTPQIPISTKGKIRVEMEKRLEAAAPDVASLILRAGDFFGPDAGSSWFTQAMISPGKPVKRIINPGKGIAHSWAYLPDLADTFVRLLEKPEALRPFERVQFEGFWDADGTGIAETIRQVVGRNVTEWGFPWWLMHALAPFGGFPREVADIAAGWRHPMQLDNQRLSELLGEESRTPFSTAIRTTLSGMGCLAEPAPVHGERAGIKLTS